MKKTVTVALSALLLCTSCAKEFNQVYKSQDWRYKYEYAKECFAQGKYTRATTLLQELIVQEKGTPDAEESLYMLAMAEYCSRDYETAAEAFKRYVKTYPRGVYAEQASYYVGQSLYMSTPEPRLDQSETVRAISAFQEYLDIYPDARMKELAQQRLFALQDKLVEKELLSARLYYDLGSYFGNCFSGGNNYEACIVTAQNALKDYPYTSKREDFASTSWPSKASRPESWNASRMPRTSATVSSTNILIPRKESTPKSTSRSARRSLPRRRNRLLPLPRPPLRPAGNAKI